MDFENDVLGILQQSAMLNFGGPPNWQNGIVAGQNPQFPQSMVDYQINRGYVNVMAAFSDLELGLYECQFTTTANTLSYPIPPQGAVAPVLIWDVGSWDQQVWGPVNPSVLPNPPIHRLARLFYAPQGLNYNLEFEPGVRMVPWKEFQRFTSSGYLENASFGTQPEICSVSPDRQTIWFYPGTANAGDVVTLLYIPIPTAGTQVPLLVSPTDTPMFLPDDIHDLITYYAASKLLPRARDAAGAAYYGDLYVKEMARLQQDYFRSSGANRQRFTDVIDDRATSGPYSWWA